jgi:hypothetical protein
MSSVALVPLLALVLGQARVAAEEGRGPSAGPLDPGEGSAAAEADLPREFKSVGCGNRELLLILSSTGSFVLLLEETGAPGAGPTRERATGRWSAIGRTVRLEGSAGRIEYSREPVRFTIGDHTFELPGLVWRNSERAGFADRCKTLVDRIGLERAVHRFAPPPPPGEG